MPLLSMTVKVVCWKSFQVNFLFSKKQTVLPSPNGGVRNTFEARGYSAWDPSSPVFVVDDTLCIPTVFIAYTGESLDYKAPLLKAIQAVTKISTRCNALFRSFRKKDYFVSGMGTGIFPC